MCLICLFVVPQKVMQSLNYKTKGAALVVSGTMNINQKNKWKTVQTKTCKVQNKKVSHQNCWAEMTCLWGVELVQSCLNGVSEEDRLCLRLIEWTKCWSCMYSHSDRWKLAQWEFKVSYDRNFSFWMRWKICRPMTGCSPKQGWFAMPGGKSGLFKIGESGPGVEES